MVIKISLSTIIDVIFNSNYLIFMVVFALIVFLISVLRYLYLVSKLKGFKKVLLEAFNQEENLEGKMSVINENVQRIKLLPQQLKQTWNRYFADYNANRNDVTLDSL